MNKEEELFKKRLLELGDAAYKRGTATFTDFMNRNELNIFHSIQKETCDTFGGYEYAERQIAVFLPDALYHTWNYPISCIKISPANIKFAGTLTHRDYLGAVLNLGIERSKIGDIVIQDKEAYLFCHNTLSEFIRSQLTRVKHTTVHLANVEPKAMQVTPNIEKIKGTVASVRLDSVMAVAYKSSRSSFAALIEGGKVFVNGKLITANAYSLAEDDMISVRGIGKLQYKGILNETKKNRFLILIHKYI